MHPIQCMICHQWFQFVDCDAECNLVLQSNHLCGICSGMGPAGNFVPPPILAIQHEVASVSWERAQELKLKQEQRRLEEETLKKERQEQEMARILHRRWLKELARQQD